MALGPAPHVDLQDLFDMSSSSLYTLILSGFDGTASRPTTHTGEHEEHHSPRGVHKGMLAKRLTLEVETLLRHLLLSCL